MNAQFSQVTKGGKLHFSKEQKLTARRASALEYARQRGYQLIPCGRGRHYFGGGHGEPDHNSMIFLENGSWFWNSRQVHGRAIDFIMYVEGRSLVEAVLLLNGVDPNQPGQGPEQKPDYTVKEEARQEHSLEFELPKRAENDRAMYGYLCSQRGLSVQIVHALADEGRIYVGKQTMPDGHIIQNVVFLSLDEAGTPRAAFLRGVGQSTFKANTPGSDKSYPFEIPGVDSSRTLCVFEAAIDAISHATLFQLKGVDYHTVHRIAIGGNAPARAIERVLDRYPEIRKIQFCLDADTAGQKIYSTMAELLQRHGYLQMGQVEAEYHPPKLGKDWNDALLEYKRSAGTNKGGENK